MRISQPLEWFKGEMRRESREASERRRKRRARLRDRPVRWGALAGALSFAVFWAIFGRSTDAASLVVLAAMSCAYAFALVWLARRTETRGQRTHAHNRVLDAGPGRGS